MQNKLPIQDNDPALEKYVARDTVKALRTSKVSTDVDFFLRSNGPDEEDWLPNVRVVGTDVDPVCVNLYMVLGKEARNTSSVAMCRKTVPGSCAQ